MIIDALLIAAGAYCTGLLIWKLIKPPEDIRKEYPPFDPEGGYCTVDYKTRPDGSLSLCGEELDPEDPDIDVPEEYCCPECLRIESVIKRNRWTFRFRP